MKQNPAIARGFHAVFAGLLFGAVFAGLALGLLLCGYPGFAFGVAAYSAIMIWMAWSIGESIRRREQKEARK